MSRQIKNDLFYLCQAVKCGDIKKVKNLIQNDVDVNPDVNDNTPLHWAIIKFKLKCLNIITMLLDNGANIHAKNQNNLTPLDIAIQDGKTTAASLLIRRGALFGEDLNSLLLKAIESSDYTIVQMIIDHGILYNSSINFQTLFNPAISSGDPKIMKAIIPHCNFLEPLYLYILTKFMIDSDSLFQNCVEMLSKCNFFLHPDIYHEEDFIYGAVEKGYLRILVDLLCFGIDVNMVNSKTGLNLLMIACLNKHHEIIEKLLEHNADVNVKISSENESLNNHSCFKNNTHGINNLFTLINHENDLIDVTCLHIAIFNCDFITTRILMKYGANIEDDTEFFNLICYAVRYNYEEIVRIFLEYGVNVADVNSKGETLLHFCFNFYSPEKDDRYNVAKLLLENGADIHLQTPGNSLVFEAIRSGHRKIGQLFLDYNADVQYISPDGDTLLHAAIKYRFDAKFIRTLLKLNSPINTVNSAGSTPLIDACIYKSEDKLEIIEALLHYNADVNCTDDDMMTPLHLTSYGENLQIIKLLLNKGANLHAVNNEGQTPLHFVCRFSSDITASRIQLLLEHGANIEAVDNRGWTPLSLACNDKNYEAAKFLLDHHANPNHPDWEHSTPLHIAVKQASMEIVKNLLKCGANINCLNKNNQTALQIADNLYRRLQFNRGNYLPSNKIDNYREVIQILQTQVVKLVIAGLKVNEEDFKIVYDLDHSSGNNIGIDMLDEKCRQEIDEMKRENISIAGEVYDITFDDLLQKHNHFVGRFVDNEDILAILEQPVYDEKYPFYIDIIRNRFRDVKYRCGAINSAKKYFYINVRPRMPDECIDMIFSYLNIVESKIFIEATKL